MATLNLTVHGVITINGTEVEFGSLVTPKAITIGTAGSEIKSDTEYVVAAGGSVAGTKIFDVAEEIADFEFLAILSDQDLTMLITVSDSNSPTEKVLHLTLTANVWFLLGKDDALAGSTSITDLTAGTLDTVDRINAYNAGTTAAKVRVIALS